MSVFLLFLLSVIGLAVIYYLLTRYTGPRFHYVFDPKQQPYMLLLIAGDTPEDKFFVSAVRYIAETTGIPLVEKQRGEDGAPDFGLTSLWFQGKYIWAIRGQRFDYDGIRRAVLRAKRRYHFYESRIRDYYRKSYVVYTPLPGVLMKESFPHVNTLHRISPFGKIVSLGGPQSKYHLPDTGFSYSEYLAEGFSLFGSGVVDHREVQIPYERVVVVRDLEV